MTDVDYLWVFEHLLMPLAVSAHVRARTHTYRASSIRTMCSYQPATTVRLAISVPLTRMDQASICRRPCTHTLHTH
jgi:hypothetical protein